MFGQTNHNDNRYYRHARHRKKECDIGFWVRADDLEDAIMTHLFSMYGDVENMEKAMLQAIPDNSKIEKLREQEQTLKKQLEKTDGQRQRLIKSIANGLISDDEAEKVIEEIRERDTLLKDEIEKIRPQIENVPIEALIKKRAKLIKRTLQAIFSRPGRLSKMSFKDKRKFVESAFGGKDAEGNRCGVYLHKPKKPGGPVTYEIKGVFADIQGQLPMSEKETERIFEHGFDSGPNSKKVDIVNKCHAHYGLCLYK
jgi:hypothetical protein